MNDHSSELNRPPLGFIVEGQGEYNCYPSLVFRILQSHGFRLPIVNAGGCGNVVRNLPSQLRSLVLAFHPREVIVTVDLRDVLKQRLFRDCAELTTALAEEASTWLDSALTDPRLQPLPARIAVVIQIQEFESWFIADCSALRRSGFLRADPPDFSNVDNEIEDPVSWLREFLTPTFDVKNPMHARSLVSALNPSSIRALSPSFDKFAREVTSSYRNWLDASGLMQP